MSTKNKHRPLLTAEEVKVLAFIAKQAYSEHLTKPPYSPDDPTNPARGLPLHVENALLSVLQKLSVLEAKIANHAIKPAYTTAPPAPPTPSIEESLGMEVEYTTLKTPITTLVPSPEGYGSKEEYWEACYQKFLIDPTSMSLAEIAAAQEWRYLEGIMSTEEAEAFEAKTMEIGDASAAEGDNTTNG